MVVWRGHWSLIVLCVCALCVALSALSLLNVDRDPSLGRASHDPKDDFVTTWWTDAQTPGGRTVHITTGEGIFNYEVDWNNDGVFDDKGVRGDIVHEYDKPGVYTVRIRGVFPHLKSPTEEDFEDWTLQSVEQWGSNRWESMAQMFADRRGVRIRAQDTPVLTDVTRMDWMFAGATSLRGDLSQWDTSGVMDMTGMFDGAEVFDGDLSRWDTSNVRSMAYMFCDARRFNQPLGAWDTSRVRTTMGMFQDAHAFNQDLEGWDTSRVQTMAYMFLGASSFNGRVDAWDTSRVRDMSAMFYEAQHFNQPVDNWDISRVAKMSWMFARAYAFDQPLEAWDTSRVTDMSAMFAYTRDFDQPLGRWDVRRVQDTRHMFLGAKSFDRPLGSWQLYSILNMHAMFDDSALSRERYDATLSGWARALYLPEGVSLGAKGVLYCRADRARAHLLTQHQWVIRGDRRQCD